MSPTCLVASVAVHQSAARTGTTHHQSPRGDRARKRILEPAGVRTRHLDDEDQVTWPDELPASSKPQRQLDRARFDHSLNGNEPVERGRSRERIHPWPLALIGSRNGNSAIEPNPAPTPADDDRETTKRSGPSCAIDRRTLGGHPALDTEFLSAGLLG